MQIWQLVVSRGDRGGLQLVVETRDEDAASVRALDVRVLHGRKRRP